MQCCFFICIRTTLEVAKIVCEVFAVGKMIVNKFTRHIIVWGSSFQILSMSNKLVSIAIMSKNKSHWWIVRIDNDWASEQYIIFRFDAFVAIEATIRIVIHS